MTHASVFSGIGGPEVAATMHACAKTFYDFREAHPEVTEMHFYTDEEMNITNE